MAEFIASALVPEFTVRDITKSLPIYCDVFGFKILYETPEHKFAYLGLGDAQVMLEEIIDLHGSLITAPLEVPYGRGVNFKILVPNAEEIYETSEKAGLQIIRPLEEQWYPKGEKELGNWQFVAADLDGYLLRFATDLGERPLQVAGE